MKKYLPFPFCPSAVPPFRPFSLFGLLSLFSFFSLSNVNAQTCQTASVELSAVVQANPPRITLNWVPDSIATQYFIHRKSKVGAAWGSSIATLVGADSTYTDSTINTNTSYEYRVTRQAVGYTGYGYINSGIEIEAVHSRGIIILVIDETFKDSLAAEIARLQSDLNGDGWKVVSIHVARTASVTTVKAAIVEAYNVDKTNTKAVFLLGHVPVPYSGSINPDGHPDHLGAWPADVYYAEVNGVWTDNSVSTEVATDPRNRNLLEDGKFDQSLLPSDVELQIGRVDFANMPTFATSEQELLRNYLNKDHAYRHKLFNVVQRGVIDDNFGFFGAEAFAASGYKNFGPLVGPDNVVANDYFATTADSSYSWVYGCGGGWFQGAGGIGSTTDFAASNLKGVFSMLFGSYFGDWDSQDNFLRAPLAQGLTLTNAWSGRPHWLFHHMGLGENIGYSTRISQNNSSLYFASYGARFVHIALMGDPTLRNDVVAPVSDVSVTKSGFHHLLTWTPSSDPVIGYYVYVKNELNTDYVLLNNEPIQDISYSHDCVDGGGLLTYMIRAVLLEESPSGSYYNLSQGITDTISAAEIPVVDALASWEVTGSAVNFTNLSTNGTSYIWGFGDGAISNEVNPQHVYQDGFFQGIMIATNGCKSDTFYYDILVFTGVNDIKDDPSIVISPNPSSGKFAITWDSAMNHVEVRLYSMTGTELYENETVGNHSVIDLTAMSPGVYIMHIVKDGVRSMKRIVMQ